MELIALLISLAGAGVIAYNVRGKTILPGTNTNFIDHAGNKKYFSPQKAQAWIETQNQITYILTSSNWQNWRNLNSFRRLTNGGKIDAVFEQIKQNYQGALHGYGYSIGGDSFSYLDFVYPGIDLDKLGAGSENDFQIFISHFSLACVGTVLSGAAATITTGGTLSIPAAAASAKACKIF